MQDSSNACNSNADIGYTSWSLICRDADHKKTTCSVLLDSMKPQFTDIQWKKSARYVTVDERVMKNFDSILKEATDEFDLENVTGIQKLSEIKDGSLYESWTMTLSLTYCMLHTVSYKHLTTSRSIEW